MFARSGLVTVTIAVITAVFSIVTYTACKKPQPASPNDCAGVVCQNNGTCISGKCSCTSGYMGDYCEKKVITPYLGKWNMNQQIIASTNKDIIGTTKNYDVTIVEDVEGVTLLKIQGFGGDPTFTASIRVAMVTTVEEVNNVITEIDVKGSPQNFIFKRYQPLGNSSIQIVKGQGQINSLGTQMSGDFVLVYPDPVKGAIEDRINFSATYIN